MRSIKDVVHTEGLSGSVSLSSVCHRYGVKSLSEMIADHDRAQRASEVRTFHADIVTPSGIPLGGWVDLEVHGNGDYKITFHMHSSSTVGDFDFDLRGYLTASGCPVFFFHHSGHVSGVDDSDYTESDTIPLIALYWSQLQAGGTFLAAKDYQWGGVVGTLDRLADDLVNLRILDFASGVVGATIGVVMGVTREALSWMDANLGPGGTIAIVGSVAIFAAALALGVSSANALVFATVSGVAAGAVTDALVASRPIGPPESGLASRVFNQTIPYDKVILTNLAGLGGRAFTAPGIDGKIYVNLGDAYNDTLGAHGSSYPADGQLLIHELTHAWQIAHGRFLPGFVCSGIVNQADYTFGDDVYKYGAAGPGWTTFNLEQQGAIVDQWWGGNGSQSSYAPMQSAANSNGPGYMNPYFLYIHDTIRAS